MGIKQTNTFSSSSLSTFAISSSQSSPSDVDISLVWLASDRKGNGDTKDPFTICEQYLHVF